MPQNNDFNKPVGKWIEETEQIERVVNSYDPQTRKITSETITENNKVKVIYEKTLLENNFCRNSEHIFKIIDSHKYIVKCQKCPLHRRISVGNEYIDSYGHIRRRDDDSIVA